MTLEEQIEFAKSFTGPAPYPDWYHMSEEHCAFAMQEIYESLCRLRGLEK